jgi:signal transduction histidine kinase
VSVRAITGLFGIGSLVGLWPLLSGTEPEAFFAPFVVFLVGATAWYRIHRGDERSARWLLTGVSLLYVAATLAGAPRLIVLAVAYPLAFLLLLLLHMIHPATLAPKLGWAALAVVGLGCVRQLLVAEWPADWPYATGAAAQTLAFAAANVVLARLGRGWTKALSALDQANQRIEASYQAALRANEAKSRFLADMSHELRTPLSAILGYSELIEDQLEDDEMPDTHDLERIQKSGRHLLELVNQVLDLSRIEAGYIDLELGAVDLSAMAREVADTMRPLAAARRTDLRIEIDDSVPPVALDALRIRQVLTNLMSNAVKFTDDGTVTIAVLHGIDDIRVVVKDTGLGIAKESLDRIFEPFEQADASVQHTHGGTGLGLAISRQLVQEMGGELSAESTAGKGSTFVVAFPRSLAVHVNRMQA